MKTLRKSTANKPKISPKALKSVLKSMDDIRTEMSKQHTVKITVSAGQLWQLKRAYEKQHNRMFKKYPKLTGRITNKKLVSYAVYDAIGRHTRKWLKTFEPKS